MCHECNGTKEIVRPMRTKTVIIERPYRGQNRIEYAITAERVRLGGADACPICAAIAEVEYQALRT